MTTDSGARASPDRDGLDGDRGDPQRVAPEPTGQQDASGLRFGRYAPDPQERQIDPGERQERLPPTSHRERPHDVRAEEFQDDDEPRPGKRRKDARLAFQAGARVAVDRRRLPS